MYVMLFIYLIKLLINIQIECLTDLKGIGVKMAERLDYFITYRFH